MGTSKDSAADDIQRLSGLLWTPSTIAIVYACGISPFDAGVLRRHQTRKARRNESTGFRCGLMRPTGTHAFILISSYSGSSPLVSTPKANARYPRTLKLSTVFHVRTIPEKISRFALNTVLTRSECRCTMWKANAEHKQQTNKGNKNGNRN